MWNKPDNALAEAPECPFLPGQEDEARTFLAQPTQFKPVKMIVERRGLWMCVLWPLISVGIHLITDPMETDGYDWPKFIFTASFTLLLLGIPVYHVIKAGYFILDPERGEIIHSGKRFSFADVRSPFVGEIEVDYMNAGLYPVVHGAIEGLKLNPQTMLLADAGFSAKKLEKLAELLAAMAAEWQLKDSVRRWLAVQRSPEARARRERIEEATSGSLDGLEQFLDTVQTTAGQASLDAVGNTGDDPTEHEGPANESPSNDQPAHDVLASDGASERSLASESPAPTASTTGDDPN